MPAPSLLHLALATAIRFVKGTYIGWNQSPQFFRAECLLTFFGYLDLDDLGAMPYMLARPILQNVQNPEKLVCLQLLSLYTNALALFSTLHAQALKHMLI